MGSRSSRRDREQDAPTDEAALPVEAPAAEAPPAEAPAAVPTEFSIGFDEWEGRQPGYGRYLLAGFRQHLRFRGRLSRRHTQTDWDEQYMAFGQGDR